MCPLAAIAIVAAHAGAQLPAQRWDFELQRGPVFTNGDLRFDGDSGRILLEHEDSTWQPLRDLRIAGSRISFTLRRGERHFDGQVSDTLMWGTMRSAAGGNWEWRALPLGPRSSIWPVPPRVTIRQLRLGNASAQERIPGAWLASLPPTRAVADEDAALARDLGIGWSGADGAPARARRLAFGLDGDAERITRGLLAQIDTQAGRSPVFRNIFQSRYGWRTSIYDVLPGEAAHYVVGFSMDNVARGLVKLGDLPSPADSSAVRYAVWQLWVQIAGDTTLLSRRLGTLSRDDPSAADNVRAAVAGFDDAVAWWHRAATWLLTQPWLETADGTKSPAQLMAAFWGVDSLPLPEIMTARFGDATAIPVVAAEHLAADLLHPDNASAREWLAGDGIRQAFGAWLPLRWGEIPLFVERGHRTEVVMSPAAEAESRPAAFLGAVDAVRIDPGVAPFAAVPIIIHEWQHLVMSERRLSGAHPPAITTTAVEVRLHDDDPWLAEGFAEWATEATLAPGGSTSAWLRFTQAAKRAAIAERDSLDPHVLGYRMLRAAASRLGATRLRDRLTADLDQLARFAAGIGLGGAAGHPPLTLDRPVTDVVLPEVTFTWEDGTVSGLSRRLVIPN